jgi:hypothetical protein
VLSTNGNQPKSLLKNMGDGTFKDVTVEAGIYSEHPTQTATWADFNLDGFLDVFIDMNPVITLPIPVNCI